MLKRKLLAQKMMAESGGDLTIPTFPVKLQHLDPIETKKARDKRRKRDQAARRVAAEKVLLEATKRRQLQADASKAWHRNTTNEEELQIKRFELDCVSPFDEHPASAGYEFKSQSFRSLTPTSVTCFTPVFFGYSLAKTSSMARPHGATRHDAPHPAFIGYTLCHHDDAASISPVFLGMEFRKREVQWGKDDMGPDLEATGPTPRSRHAAVVELRRIMDARFSDMECLVCESSQLQGCPGCWEPPSNFYSGRDDPDNGRHTTMASTPEQRTPLTPNPNGLRRRDGRETSGGAPSIWTSQPAQIVTSSEAKWRRDLLIDKYAIRQHREKKQSFVVVVIKRVPAGNVVTLQLDATSTVKYLYDLYRFNDGATVDHACGRQFYLVLPTTQGLFWMDEVVLAASDRTLAVTRGDLTLLDFKLNPTTGASSIATYMMLAVATIHDEKTPAMLAQYIKHNFVVAPLHHVALRRHANEVPDDVLADPLQQSMSRKRAVLVESALVNRRMSREYERIATRKAVKAVRDEKMVALVERSRHQTNQPRPRKVIRAYAYFSFAMAEPKPLLRLAKLWQCFQKFDELKITKRGKLLDAAYSDDTASLLSQHRSAAVDAFDVLVDKAKQSVMHPVLAVRDKFGIPLGTRYGVTAKEDREYAVELDILLPEDVDVKMEDPAAASPGPPRPRRHFHDYLAAQTAAAVWKDMEWRKDARSDKFYGGADLVVAPYCLVRWDCFTQAYVLARGHLVRAKDHLDAYNRLAKPLQTEAIMKPHEIERWTSELESLLRELPATGALTQACRRLQSKAGLLPARAKRYHQALKKSRDDAAKALANHDELPRMSGTEKLKLDFKLREGILSNNFRQLAPDMDVVKERMATVMRNGMGKTKVFAQHVKDNIEILKL
ncbi:hypothetical protein H310_00097 [Aphanomyces invadans]|uniref:Uncharacterized protein n=1 Tax=Aphanomyces invadans TaxID=157072 RepID=A0A024UV71_9STRA|nr:hypothetical protein H310_00097 [Aphanomyces invadans]ETW09543.1 hypothetical protein H310_00097 [Aphanomyces invadans]|eukprot:XP_008860954.1 hypothetical protein H310_00097 [Aphanomyces invadans]